MRKGLMLAAASLFVLSACSQEREPGTQRSADEAATVELVAPGASAVQTPIAAPPAPVAQIAYAYTYALSLPRDRGAEMMSRHELACSSAGPGYCQVISAQADWIGREPGGRLELRGQPEWINRFRAGMALDAQNAGGRLDAATTEGEDVTRGIDTAQTVSATSASLTDRLGALQAQRGGTLAQRLEVEREIAKLRAEYDAQQIALRELNDRVQSARLTLDYRQGGVMAADNPMRPVARALADALGLDGNAGHPDHARVGRPAGCGHRRPDLVGDPAAAQAPARLSRNAERPGVAAGPFIISVGRSIRPGGEPACRSRPSGSATGRPA